MLRVAITFALLLFTVAGLAAAEDTGALQVTCRPGVRVYLDGDFVGLTTADEDGLFLRAVAAGGHAVRVEKLGFEPMELEVEVRAGRATELRVGELLPAGAAPAPTAAPPESVATPALAPTPTAPAVQAAVAPAAALPTVAPLPPPVVPAPPLPTAVASAVAVAPAERAPAPTPPPTTPPTPSPVAAPTVVLRSSVRPASDVAFAYRASGAAAADGRSIAIWRERGGPRAPVLVLTCSDGAGCEQQTSPRFAPGTYRFRVAFSRTRGEGAKAETLFRHEISLDLDARPGATYLVEAVFGGDDPARCTATVREARFVPGQG